MHIFDSLRCTFLVYMFERLLVDWSLRIVLFLFSGCCLGIKLFIYCKYINRLPTTLLIFWLLIGNTALKTMGS